MKVTMYTDGSARGNPDGPGGYGTLIQFIDSKGQLHEREFSAGYKKTTNNRMELTAVIEALSKLKEPCKVKLTTDSKYVCDAVLKEWVYSWQKNGWRKADKKPALNIDLWERLLILIENHSLEINWVKGHEGHPENERCDRLAVAESQKHNNK